MDATAELTETPARENYTSRPGALIWFFGKSREQWRLKAEQASQPANLGLGI